MVPLALATITLPTITNFPSVFKVEYVLAVKSRVKLIAPLLKSALPVKPVVPVFEPVPEVFGLSLIHI